MPELPDIALYLSRLEPRLVGERLDDVRVKSPFLVRTVDPPLREAKGRIVTGLRRLGKRIVIGLAGDVFLVFHF
jgi:formamidopyrimidine-DNA glycosylase